MRAWPFCRVWKDRPIRRFSSSACLLPIRPQSFFVISGRSAISTFLQRRSSRNRHRTKEQLEKCLFLMMCFRRRISSTCLRTTGFYLSFLLLFSIFHSQYFHFYQFVMLNLSFLSISHLF